MATRSRIGYQLKDGSIISVYCHWDGYPQFNGVKLKEHFNTRDAVSELIDGGDISALYTNVGWNNETLPTSGPLYYSERGDRDIEPKLSNSHDEFVKLTDDCTGEYAYLFVNGTWTCYDVNESKYISLYEEVSV